MVVSVPSLAVFQSTRPVRGETAFLRVFNKPVNISIHSPRAGRDFFHRSFSLFLDISIHSPRAGRDSKSVQVILLWFVHF